MRMCDVSSGVGSSDRELRILKGKLISLAFGLRGGNGKLCSAGVIRGATEFALSNFFICHPDHLARKSRRFQRLRANAFTGSIHAASTCNKRSEEHTSELQSLMRISYAVFCLKKKKRPQTHNEQT